MNFDSEHICQLPGIPKSESACETPIYRIFSQHFASRNFMEKFKSEASLNI